MCNKHTPITEACAALCCVALHCTRAWRVPAPVQPPAQLGKLLEEVSGPGGTRLQAGITGGHSWICCQVLAAVVLPLALLPLPLLLALGVGRFGGVLLRLRGAARHDLGKLPRLIPVASSGRGGSSCNL
jgi:hypothetical protein